MRDSSYSPPEAGQDEPGESRAGSGHTKEVVLNLNEFTLPLFLILCWTRRRVHVLTVQPLLPLLQPFLERLAGRMIERGKAGWAVDLVPELRPVWDYDKRLFFDEIFKKYEPWQNGYYDFEWADQAREPYGYAYKLVTTNHVFGRVLEIYLIEALVRRCPGVRIRGITRDSFDMCRSHFGGRAVSGIHPMRVPAALINVVSMIITLAAGTAFIARRIRLACRPREIFFAFEWVNDPRDFLMCESVADGGEILLIHRNDEYWNKPIPGCDKYRQVRWTDGAFPMGDGVRTLFGLFRETLYLWRKHHSLSPALFSKTIAMPYRRVMIHGLFNLYRPRYTWGRDDYNVEHILRRHELGRIGGKSLGVNHAVLSNFCSLIPQWRYISFDTYYTYGKPLCAPYFPTWVKDMEVRSAGVFSVSRERILADWSTGDAILFSVRVAWNEPEFGRMISAVAEAFPHIPILIQVKPGYISEAEIAGHIARWTKGHPNAAYTTERIYDLMERARYHISDISTIIGEAMQLGVRVFFADVMVQEFSIFRKFPGLSIRTADDLVRRMKALESGGETYPFEEYQIMMDITPDKTIFDIVREDVGLPALEAPETLSPECSNTMTQEAKA
jgi:hypothetical protein